MWKSRPVSCIGSGDWCVGKKKKKPVSFPWVAGATNTSFPFGMDYKQNDKWMV